MSSATLPLYPSCVDHSSKETLVILDGGLGTTLEQTFGLDISNTALWSAKAAIEHPEVIVAAHLAFLRAGARIILTSTYQCALSTFQTAGYADADAYAIMAACVRLAAEARLRFRDEQSRPDAPGPDNPAAKIVLSLGPFGAGLVPAQEFDGFYPPPFGPRGYTPGGSNCNAFGGDAAGQAAEEAATAALARFHFERLCVFADDEATWAGLDFIAFETVPLVREIRAIRRAMAALEARRGVGRKPWWISFVFPEGQFPESVGDGERAKIPVRSVVAAALQTDGRLEHLPCPSALGINCTAMDAIPRVLAEMEAAVLEFRAPEQDRPWLVIYPNGGDVYDPVSQTWVVQDKRSVWAEQLTELVAETQSRGVWAGVVAGGCCRTGPEDIALLSKLHRR
ncbi:Homocysteine S-methyltransferase [Mycena rosella]|uniref:Homocysteine S-methyltransferase n=1 Tax=Mycena rosella TaxID=1033263 RepID=A0AAD7D4K2_MYCRO|nr:Homocysteine S-methyltransferase [Mycena rosella]